MVLYIVCKYFIYGSNQYYRDVARDGLFEQSAGCSVRMRISLKKSGLRRSADYGESFARRGKCSGCLTYPCKPRQSVFARAGYHAWRQQPYLRGPVGGGRPWASHRHDYYAEPASGPGVSIKRAVGSIGCWMHFLFIREGFPFFIPRHCGALAPFFSANA